MKKKTNIAKEQTLDFVQKQYFKERNKWECGGKIVGTTGIVIVEKGNI